MKKTFLIFKVFQVQFMFCRNEVIWETKLLFCRRFARCRMIVNETDTYKIHQMEERWGIQKGHLNASIVLKEEMILTSPIETLGLTAFFWVVTLDQGNQDRKHQISTIVSPRKYIIRMQVLLKCCFIEIESSQLESWNHLFCRKVLFLNDHHCKFLYASQNINLI